MIINARSYGQLGNRLFLYAHMIAVGKHLGVSVANPCFAEYAHLFPSTASDLWCRYPVQSSDETPPTLRRRKWLAKTVESSTKLMATVGLRKWPANIVKLKNGQTYDLASEEFAKLANDSKHLLLSGWLFRSEELLWKYADEVRAHFRIHTANQSRIDQLLQARRNNGDVLIGVHIRQGDYATFQGGEYFYTTRQYAQMMRQVSAELSPLNPCFLVCGTGAFSQQDFRGLNVIFGTGQIIEDLYSLAETDLLIGPPSTFTLWASFFGGAPLSQMNDSDSPVDVSPLRLRRAA